MSNLGELDALARRMLAEASKLEAAGGGAADIAKAHLERMIEKARSLALGGDLSPADLARLQGELRRIAGECAWRLAGIGNRESWAFSKVVEAIRLAKSATDPILDLAGVQIPSRGPDVDALARAMQKLDKAFRGSSADMARAVESELVRMVTAGAKPEEIAKRLVAQNVVDPVAGMTPQARAEVIARTETMRVYRQAVRDRAERAPGLTHWRMVGPMTQKTSALCRTFNGRVLSDAQWREIMGERWDSGEHAGRGLHPNCRHSWQPCRPEWLGVSDGSTERTGAFNNDIAKAHDADASLPAYSLGEFLGLPAAERQAIMSDSARGFRLKGAA